MNESKRIHRLLGACAVVILGTPTVAQAVPYADDNNIPAVRVSYADLNLSNRAGVEVLYKRLRGASLAVCGSQHSLRQAGSLENLIENKQCYRGALSEAVAGFDNATLNRIHAR